VVHEPSSAEGQPSPAHASSATHGRRLSTACGIRARATRRRVCRARQSGRSTDQRSRLVRTATPISSAWFGMTSRTRDHARKYAGEIRREFVRRPFPSLGASSPATRWPHVDLARGARRLNGNAVRAHAEEAGPHPFRYDPGILALPAWPHSLRSFGGARSRRHRSADHPQSAGAGPAQARRPAGRVSHLGHGTPWSAPRWQA